MDKGIIALFSAELTYADIACGYIPNEPVMNNRNELIKERQSFYINLLQEIISSTDDLNEDYFKVAVTLAGADVHSQYISRNPVLYDRDDMIKERIYYYYQEAINIYDN